MTEVADRPTTRAPTVIIAASTVAVGVGASLGFLPGFLASALRDDLGISLAQIGLLISVHFGCTGLGSMYGGVITERVGARLAVVADQVIVAAAAIVAATVASYAALIVAAVFAGFGYALANAGTNVAVARAVGQRRRALALSVKTAGVPFMALVSAGIGPWAASQWSWQAVVMIVGLIAAASAVLSAATLPPDRPELATRRGRTERSPLPKQFAWFAVAAFLLIAGSQPFYAWTVAFLDEGVGTSEVTAGAVSAGASAVGVVVMVLSALHADRVGPSGRVALIVALTLVVSAASLAVMGGIWLGVGVVVVGATFGVAAQLAAIGSMHAAVVDRAPDAVARATGLTMTGYYLGALAAPVGFGWLTDATGTYGWSWLATGCAALLAAAAFVRCASVGSVSADQA